MRLKHCPTTHKVQYKNAHDAKRNMARQHAKFGGFEQDLVQHTQTPYRCAHCGRWHLTSMDPETSAEFGARIAYLKGRA